MKKYKCGHKLRKLDGKLWHYVKYEEDISFKKVCYEWIPTADKDVEESCGCDNPQPAEEKGNGA
jgi:hypothetical protein